ncbi:MAG: DNA repair protein RecO [Litorilinea sp.]
MTPNRQRIYRSHALILRRRDYSEADRILTVLTPHRGKQELIAKGIRKTSSRKAGHLELYTHTSLMLAEGRTWDVVTEVSTVESYRKIREDLEKISQAGYLCELADAFSESEDENLPLWDLVILGLRALNDDWGPCNGPMLLRWFVLHLLSLTGFQPQLFHCIACETPLEPVLNRLDLAAGGVICPNCAYNMDTAETIEPDVLKVLRYLQSNDWDASARLALRPAIAGRIDNILHRYLLQVLERHLRSTEFMRRIQYLAPALPSSAPPAAAETPTSLLAPDVTAE